MRWAAHHRPPSPRAGASRRRAPGHVASTLAGGDTRDVGLSPLVDFGGRLRPLGQVVRCNGTEDGGRRWGGAESDASGARSPARRLSRTTRWRLQGSPARPRDSEPRSAAGCRRCARSLRKARVRNVSTARLDEDESFRTTGENEKGPDDPVPYGDVHLHDGAVSMAVQVLYPRTHESAERGVRLSFLWPLGRYKPSAADPDRRCPHRWFDRRAGESSNLATNVRLLHGVPLRQAAGILGLPVGQRASSGAKSWSVSVSGVRPLIP